ncbi:MAG: nicotinate-nicotinamide nucleotide adenylyltransferase, partial [Kiritimatiellia bacterium]
MNQKAERLGILGGTFNPIHHGHLLAARAARESLDLDRLLLVPNSRSPLRMG